MVSAACTRIYLGFMVCPNFPSSFLNRCFETKSYVGHTLVRWGIGHLDTTFRMCSSHSLIGRLMVYIIVIEILDCLLIFSKYQGAANG